MATTFEERLDQTLGSSQGQVTGSFGGRLDEFIGGQRQSQNIPSGFTGIEGAGSQASPLSFQERVILSFSDPETKRNILAERFKFVQDLPNGKLAVGNNIREMRPIDPEGLFNDVPGDLADIASIIPPIAGQITGGILGIPGGPAGVVAGGAVGAGLGELASKGIGRGLGVNEQNAQSVATDVLVSSAFGALGEGIGLGLKAAGPFIAKQGTRAVNAILKRNPLKRELGTSILAKTLKVASNVEPEATRVALKFGPDQIFNKFNSNSKNIVQVSREVVDDIFAHRTELGNQLGAAVTNLGKTANKQTIKAGDEVGRFLKELVDNDLLTPDFKLNKAFITDGSDLTIFGKIMKQLNVKPSKSGASITFKTDFSPKEIIGLKRQLAAKFDSLSSNSTRLVTKFRKGLSAKLDDFANKTQNTDFIVANKKFSQFADDMSNLKEAGFNFDKPSSVEAFITGFFKKSETAKAALSSIDSQTPLPILNRIQKFAAAQEFKGANPNILRFGFIMGLFGLSMAETPGGKLGAVALAILSGTPAGNRILLQAGQRVFRGIPLKASLPQNLLGGPQVARRTLTALLSQTARPKQEALSR